MAVLITGGIITLALIFAIAVAVVTIFLYNTKGIPVEPTYERRMRNYISRRDELAAKPLKTVKSDKNENIEIRRDNDQNFINVAGYGRIRGCCNQTARLNEQYCVCGRSVPQKLRILYNKN